VVLCRMEGGRSRSHSQLDIQWGRVDESEINRWGKRREREREEKHTVEEFG